jgi:membrane-associated protease RseP (regulator of RpoE activity)
LATVAGAIVWISDAPADVPLAAQSVLSVVRYAIGIYVALVFALLVHELGHLVAGRMLGRRCMELGIGRGRKIFERRYRSLSFVFYALPFAGHVYIRSVKRFTRREKVIFAGAGPLANVLLILALYGTRNAASGEFVAHLSIWTAVWSVSFLLGSLTSTHAKTARGVFPSDGQQILAALFPERYRKPKRKKKFAKFV